MNAQLAYEFSTSAAHEDAQAKADREYEAFEQWRDALPAVELVEWMNEWMFATTHVSGVLVGEVKSRAPYLGQWAKVEWNAAAAFDDWLLEKWRGMAEAQWERSQERYA